MIRSFRFVKHFFWFSDHAVEPQHLSGFLRNEKPEIGHHTAAYATQSGKGLMFCAKRVEDKTQPAGILDLVNISVHPSLRGFRLMLIFLLERSNRCNERGPA